MKAMLIHPPRQIACSDRLFPPGSPCWCPGHKGGSGFQKTRPDSTRSDNQDNGDEYVKVMDWWWWWSWSWWWSCKKRLITLESMLTQMKTTWTTLGLRRSLRINWRALSPEFRFNNCQHDLNWLCGASMTRALYTIYSLWILYGHILYSIYVISSARIRPSYIPPVNM